ncbi:MAG: helix-turn-helix domain-containing protein [Planctomycetota bacterium]|nr:helix-turn-helix domain-containing protein [Planctomycetota bacterium]
MQATTEQPKPAALVLTTDELATALRISPAMVFKLKAAGKLPAPVRLGRGLRWRRAEVEAWLEAGCPALESWEAQRA